MGPGRESPAISAFPSPAVRRVSPSRLLRVLLGFPSSPSQINKHPDRLLPCFLPPFCGWRRLDRWSTDCYPVRIPKFTPELLGGRQVDVGCRPMPVGCEVVSATAGTSFQAVSRPNPLCRTRTNACRHHRRGERGGLHSKEKPIEIRQPSPRPPSIGESGVGQLPRPRKRLGGGPSSPFASPRVKLSAVRVDASILTPRSDHVFCG